MIWHQFAQKSLDALKHHTAFFHSRFIFRFFFFFFSFFLLFIQFVFFSF